MSTDTTGKPPYRPSLLLNWMSLTGLVVVIGSLFSFFLLFMLDAVAHFSNPYIGILTYIIAPGFLISGLLLTLVGVLRERHKRGGTVGLFPVMQVDLSRPRDRRRMAAFLAGTLLFLFLSAVGSYNTYNFTESVQFCGETCHTVMKPELVTFAHGPHARVACAECHIGPGATWFVRSKLSGTYQVYATAFDKYPRPILTPIRNLRPAQETCEECHWPKKFVGNLDRTFTYFQSDETNTPYTIRLLIKVGGGDPTHGPVGGIHWHMIGGNTVEYIATDPARQKIPWVRMTDAQGVVTVFRDPKFTNDISRYEIRNMDCMDCHNRPAHRYMSPDSAINLALSLREIDPAMPWIKTNAVYVLTRHYQTDEKARDGIATLLAERYPNDPRIRQAIPVVQQIYRDNFFPEMKADWSVYPDNIGHMIWPGCFRCHDGKHKSEDGTRTIKANDCNACHTILAQGGGDELLQLSPGGQPFKHPGGDYDLTCYDCHNGGL
jgi:nitrate/TMAO reductase-like tetraheme cytochrome c subunit